jgi:hypothetical protein
MEEVPCCHCGEYFTPNPRQKCPRYCRKSKCKRARKAAWQREKVRGDPDYRANQKQCQQDWCKAHPDYWKQYRQQHPDQARRNRDLQRVRNARRRSRGRGDPTGMKGSMIAKMDASKPFGTPGKTTFSGQFWLVPVIAKMDALKVNIYGIPTSCE